MATAGKDKFIRLYDEQTKSIVMKMKESSEHCGHSNRVFCVKFDPMDYNMVASGGWDNTLQIYDIRKKGPVASIYGPHICGESIDWKNDGHTILTGSYRQDDVLEFWDTRTFEKFKDIKWDGPKVSEQTQEDHEHEHHVDHIEDYDHDEEEKKEEPGIQGE